MPHWQTYNKNSSVKTRMENGIVARKSNDAILKSAIGKDIRVREKFYKSERVGSIKDDLILGLEIFQVQLGKIRIKEQLIEDCSGCDC